MRQSPKPLLLVILLLLGVVSVASPQENLAWQLHYGPFPGTGRSVESIEIDGSGDAYLTFLAGTSIHLAEISPDRKVLFDETVALASSNATTYTQYSVYGSKLTPADGNIPARITVLGTQITPKAAFALNLAVWMDQFDLTGKPLWKKPLVIGPDGTLNSFDVGPDGTCYIGFGNSTASYVGTVSNTGAVTKTMGLGGYTAGQRLSTGDWIANWIPAGAGQYTWGIISGTTAKLKYEAPVPAAAPENELLSNASALPDGNIFVLHNIQSSVEETFVCDLFKADGTKIGSTEPASGFAKAILPTVPGAPIYLLVGTATKNVIESLSSGLAVNWTENIILPEDVVFTNGWANGNGLLIAPTTVSQCTSTTWLTHYNLCGSRDWQTSYTVPAVSSAVDLCAASGSTTYFIISATDLIENGDQTFDFDFDLVRLTTAPTAPAP